MSIPETTSPNRTERVRRTIGAGDLPTYVLTDMDLAHGSSLGDSGCWVTTKATGAIEAVFSLDLGRNVFGTCLLRYCGTGLHMVGPEGRPAKSGEQPQASGQTFVQLTPTSPGRFEIHPVYQRHTFTLPGDVDVEETVFLPMLGIDSAEPAACIAVGLHNRSTSVRKLRIYAFAELAEGPDSHPVVSFDPEIQALKIRTEGHPEQIRLVAFDRPPSAYESTRDRSMVYQPYEKRPLSNETTSSGDVMAALQLDVDLPVGGCESISWLLCFSNQGETRARESLHRARKWEEALERSVAWCSEALSASRVMVPEGVINDGVLWAKVNMLRVMGRYPTGAGFTNDPGRSSNVVARDLSWFVYGCDYLMPRYSAELLRNVARLQQESGKIVEFWDGRTGKTEDYGLNVNDDTPLFILAAGHHFMVSHDEQFLREIYPAVARAARYLLSQKDDRGLIFCTAEGTEEHGICGWRNVTPGTRISGAVTEVNAECCGALRMAAELARALGNVSDAGDFLDEAVGLNNAITRHLVNPASGLYYLNIDLDGNPNQDVTCDQLFPVMFGVSPPEVAFLVISRLAQSDFWTPAGLRTASSYSPEYTPDRDWGLRGGVWPGVSFWYAFAAAKYHPESMESALASYRHYCEDPLRYNTVPGQFSEWFDGESLANRGMRLSPWEPPRMVWAAIEGMLGVAHGINGRILRPLVPPRWKWLAVRHLPNGQQYETLFLARHGGQLHLYGDMKQMATQLASDSYDRDVSDSVRSLHPEANAVALARGGELLVCVGSSAESTISAPLEMAELLEDDLWYYLEIYNSELDDWVKGAMRPARKLEHVALLMEPGGFRLLRMVPVHL